MFGLDVDTLRAIRECLAQLPNIDKVIIYGSRAKGNYKVGSDIDITLLGSGLTLSNSVYPLSELLYECYLPYKVDISVFSMLDSIEFIGHVLRAGKVFYQKDVKVKEGWKIKKLEDVCEYDKSKHNGGSLPYVGLENIEPATGKYLGDFEPSTVKSSTFRFSSSHLLYGRLRPYLNKVLMPDFDGHCSTEIFPIKLKDDILRKYLFYWLIMDSTVTKIDATWTGARMPRANMVEVIKFKIPIPSLSEQKQIVAILDQVFRAIDQAKANIERNIENAKELFQSKLNEVFSQRGEGWECLRLCDICESLDSKRVPITKSKRTNGEIPYYGASGIVDYVDNYLFNENLLLVSEDGANLLARTYPIAFSISGKTWVNNHAHVLRFKNLTNQKIVEYYLNSIKLDNYISGMAQPKLNQSKLNSIPIPFPSIDSQIDIINKLEKLKTLMKDISQCYSDRLSSLEQLKKSILQKAFLGML